MATSNRSTAVQTPPTARPHRTNHDAPARLRWTGHALPDVAIATACAFCGRSEPSELTLADLDALARWLEEVYAQPFIGNYLLLAFTNNGPFTNPNPKIKELERRNKIDRVLWAHRIQRDRSVEGERCVFTGEPADQGLNRDRMPLFSAEGVSHFRPNGQSSLPVYGPLATALAALPMGSRKASGRLLLVHGEDPRTTLEFARRFLEDNRRLIALMPTMTTRTEPCVANAEVRALIERDSKSKGYKYADVKAPQAFILCELGQIARSRDGGYGEHRAEGLQVLWLSNSGQGPSLDRFEVPGPLARFVRLAQGASTRKAWDALVARFRAINTNDGDLSDDNGTSPRARRKSAPRPGGPGWSDNSALSSLLAVFDGGFIDRAAAARWLQDHVLKAMVLRDARERSNEFNGSAWALSELFLQEVLAMKRERIEAIRAFADRCAEAIARDNDRKLYEALVFSRYPWQIRAGLMQWQRRSAEGGRPSFSFDEYARVWLGVGDEAGDDRLVADLVTIRLIERLADSGWLSSAPAFPTTDNDESAERDSIAD
jgi:hypothetical protein